MKKRCTEEPIIRIGPVGPSTGQRRYSSLGCYLRGMVTEGAAGRAYHEVVRAEPFEPLEMDATVESSHEWPRAAKVLHHYLGVDTDGLRADSAQLRVCRWQLCQHRA